MKRILLLFLVILLCLPIMAACSNGPEAQTETPSRDLSAISPPPEYSTLKPTSPIPQPDLDADDTEEPEKVVRYAASSESTKYHRINCHYVDRIKSYNIVYYYTKEEAKRAEKKPCSVCNP